jgi:hypothetical protein
MAADRDDVVSECNVMQPTPPEHARVVSLRLQGKRWSEIAHALGVTVPTIWRWREQFHYIDEMIAAESQDFLESTKHRFAALIPKAAEAIDEVIVNGTYQERLQAARLVTELFKKEGTATTPADVLGRMKALGAVSDDDLDAHLVAPNVLARAKPR